jgi:hypothetical protein
VPSLRTGASVHLWVSPHRGRETGEIAERGSTLA